MTKCLICGLESIAKLELRGVEPGNPIDYGIICYDCSVDIGNDNLIRKSHTYKKDVMALHHALSCYKIPNRCGNCDHYESMDNQCKISPIGILVEKYGICDNWEGKTDLKNE